MSIHIIPRHDLFPHVEEGIDCSCSPLIEWADESGERYREPLVIHHAFDKREVWERDHLHLQEEGH